MPTTSVSTPWRRRLVRPFLGALAVILFGLLGHQLVQEPDVFILAGSSEVPVTDAAVLFSLPADTMQEPTAFVLSVTRASDGLILELAASDESRHLPWSELGSFCLFLAVALLLVAMTSPRRSLLHWWLPRDVRAGGGRLTVADSSVTLIALSVCRT